MAQLRGWGSFVEPSVCHQVRWAVQCDRQQAAD